MGDTLVLKRLGKMKFLFFFLKTYFFFFQFENKNYKMVLVAELKIKVSPITHHPKVFKPTYTSRFGY